MTGVSAQGGVIGLGYVGLPRSMELAREGVLLAIVWPICDNQVYCHYQEV